MSRRTRIACAVGLIAALAAAAAWFALRDDALPKTSELPSAHVERDLAGRAFTAALDSDRAKRRRQARAEDPSGEPGPALSTLQLYARTQADVEPVARSFHAAFSRYEVGDVDAAALRGSASAAFVRELLAEPPRRVPAIGRPAPARLGRLELVPRSGDGGSLTAVDLVGTVHRGGRSEPIAIELRKREGRWLVWGLGL